MLKVRFVVASLGLAMIFPLVPALCAQAPAAPLPPQILAAKKVFISNADAGSDSSTWSGGPAQPYNELYAAIKSWGRYEFAGAPSDADLVLQISFANPIAFVASGTSYDSGQITLVLIDPKTNIVLWTFNGKISTAHGEKGRDNALAGSIGKLVSDLKALTAQPTGPNAAR